MQELDFIRSVLEKHPGRPCVTCSFQIEGVVLLDQIRRVRPSIDVLFVDTGYHFAETYAYRDRLAREWSLNLINLRPETAVEVHEGAFGKLYASHPDQCCQMRKVRPLMKALENYDLWFSGLRREQSPTRAHIERIGTQTLPSGKPILKVSPLALWSWEDVWGYAAAHDIEYLPLYDRGYQSIGCEPCTSLPTDEENPRSGRWAGRKLECGIHSTVNLSFDSRSSL